MQALRMVDVSMARMALVNALQPYECNFAVVGVDQYCCEARSKSVTVS